MGVLWQAPDYARDSMTEHHKEGNTETLTLLGATRKLLSPECYSSGQRLSCSSCVSGHRIHAPTLIRLSPKLKSKRKLIGGALILLESEQDFHETSGMDAHVLPTHMALVARLMIEAVRF